jgi:hypothetical protein
MAPAPLLPSVLASAIAPDGEHDLPALRSDAAPHRHWIGEKFVAAVTAVAVADACFDQKLARGFVDAGLASALTLCYAAFDCLFVTLMLSLQGPRDQLTYSVFRVTIRVPQRAIRFDANAVEDVAAAAHAAPAMTARSLHDVSPTRRRRRECRRRWWCC